jgi:hypothetical protein
MVAVALAIASVGHHLTRSSLERAIDLEAHGSEELGTATSRQTRCSNLYPVRYSNCACQKADDNPCPRIVGVWSVVMSG